MPAALSRSHIANLAGLGAARRSARENPEPPLRALNKGARSPAFPGFECEG